MTTNLKIFAFSGNGNYSNVAGWDNGLSCHISKEVSFDEAYDTDSYNGELDAYSVTGNVLPCTPERGVYVFFHNETGGSRTVEGWVIAPSEESAITLLANYSETFPIVEYEAN